MFFRNLEFRNQFLSEGIRATPPDFQTNQWLCAPLSEHFLNLCPKIRFQQFVFLAFPKFRISGNAKKQFFFCLKWQHPLVEEFHQNIRRSDSDEPCRTVFQSKQCRHLLRKSHDGIISLIQFSQQHRLIVLQLRQPIDSGKEPDGYLLQKDIPEVCETDLPLRAGQFLIALNPHFFFPKILSNLLVDLLPLVIQKPCVLADLLQLPRRAHSRKGIPILRRHPVQIHQAADPHHEKFIQIAGKNLHEIHRFQFGNGFIQRFFQTPLVKPQPGQLSILRIAFLV